MYLPQSAIAETWFPLPRILVFYTSTLEIRPTADRELGAHFLVIRVYYSLDQLMQIQLNILFQINICPTAFRLAITHRKYPSLVTWHGNAPTHIPQATIPPTKQTQSASCRVFATSHRVPMIRIWLPRINGWRDRAIHGAEDQTGAWQWCTFVLKALRWHLPLASFRSQREMMCLSFISGCLADPLLHSRQP